MLQGFGVGPEPKTKPSEEGLADTRQRRGMYQDAVVGGSSVVEPCATPQTTSRASQHPAGAIPHGRQHTVFTGSVVFSLEIFFLLVCWDPRR